jgi:hypothetical protein
MEDLQLTYMVVVNNADEHDRYGRTHIEISHRRPICLLDKIASCAGDPSYYGRPEQWEKLVRMGHRVSYEIAPFIVCLTYQHFLPQNGHEEGYCGARIGESESLRNMVWATKTLNVVTREVAKDAGNYYGPKDTYSVELNNPERVAWALEKIKAKRIELVSPGYAECTRYVDALAPVPAWRGTQHKEEVA